MQPVDFGVDASQVCNAQNRSLYKAIEVEWSRPRLLPKAGEVLIDDEFLEPGYLYAIVRNHGNSRFRDTIVYIGITNNLGRRFGNHPKVDEIRAIRGNAGLSIGAINFGSYRTAIGKGNRRALEELEHIFVWTLSDDLWNEKKQYTLPGMGKNGGRAWDITNVGYKFSGRMPSRIVYPWIIIEPRRNRTAKR